MAAENPLRNITGQQLSAVSFAAAQGALSRLLDAYPGQLTTAQQRDFRLAIADAAEKALWEERRYLRAREHMERRQAVQEALRQANHTTED